VAVHVLTTYPEEGAVNASWPALANAESGNHAQLSKWPTKSVHAVGTFGAGGSVAIEGSNDGTNWAVLRDGTGTDIALTAATIVRDILENTRFIRPRVTAGDGTTSLNVIISGM